MNTLTSFKTKVIPTFHASNGEMAPVAALPGGWQAMTNHDDDLASCKELLDIILSKISKDGPSEVDIAPASSTANLLWKTMAC